jgi:hypothetical protein
MGEAVGGKLFNCRVERVHARVKVASAIVPNTGRRPGSLLGCREVRPGLTSLNAVPRLRRIITREKGARRSERPCHL